MPLLKHKSLQAINQTCIIIHIDRNQKAFTAQKTQTAKVSVKGILSRRQIVELMSLHFWKNSESTVLRQSSLSTKPTAKMHHLFWLMKSATTLQSSPSDTAKRRDAAWGLRSENSFWLPAGAPNGTGAPAQGSTTHGALFFHLQVSEGPGFPLLSN